VPHLSLSFLEIVGLGILAFTICLSMLRWLIPHLKSRGYVVPDYHKTTPTMVPRPGGPAVILALSVGSALAHLITGEMAYAAFTLVVLVAGFIGLVDDFRKLGGLTKPALLLLAGAPILLLGAYEPRLALPLMGAARLTIVYPLLIPLAITVTANTVNTIDVLNGVVSAFMAIASLPLLIASVLKGSQVGAVLSLLLLASSLALYTYHRHPSRIFPGDSGSLSLGAAYGATAILAGVEIVGVVALLPAIFNSFLFLSSVKRLVEHSKVEERPIVVRDGLLHASKSRTAPVTLVRLLLVRGPLSEVEAGRAISMLAAFAALLAVVTALLTWWARLR
jgi:UDP-N-acetylmuramyl pentapeptide phosphotransferase/UDP-N-acetylglucosamine-1-phosphate transferase